MDMGCPRPRSPHPILHLLCSLQTRPQSHIPRGGGGSSTAPADSLPRRNLLEEKAG